MRQRGVECEEVNMKRTYVWGVIDYIAALWNVRVPKRIKRSEKRFAAGSSLHQYHAGQDPLTRIGSHVLL